MALAALVVDEVGHPHTPEVFGAGSFDRFFRNALWSRSSVDNFFNDGIGEVFAPLVASSAIIAVASSLGGRTAYTDGITRAVPMLWIGIAGDQLPVAIFKKSFGRERPYLKFDNQLVLQELGVNDTARESFYSGHATTAFFTATFADAVIADIVRSMGHPDYGLVDGSWSERLVRFGQVVGLYGLAFAVAYSRIEIDQHYMTDVLFGAAVGSAHGYLTYRWGYRREAPAVAVAGLPGGYGLTVSWRF
jgi:membrane-associated phospholipid phosphatase